MSFLWVTIPVSMTIAVVLLALVIHGVRTGVFDDWDGPAWRLHHDADEVPELPDVKSSLETTKEEGGQELDPREALPTKPETRC